MFLEIKCKIVQGSEADLKYGAGVAADVTKTHAPYFCNNVLHLLFSDCSVSSNGIKISNENGNYTHENFIETEFPHNKDANATWLASQGYSYEENPRAIPAAELTDEKLWLDNLPNVLLWKSSCRFFSTCNWHLLSGVTLRVCFQRSTDAFVKISDDAAKSYKVKILEANFYVRKMTLNYDVVSAIEKTLLSSPSSYPYLETMTKAFLASTGLQSWKQEDVFSREPIRQSSYFQSSCMP